VALYKSVYYYYYYCYLNPILCYYFFDLIVFDSLIVFLTHPVVGLQAVRRRVPRHDAVSVGDQGTSRTAHQRHSLGLRCAIHLAGGDDERPRPTVPGLRSRQGTCARQKFHRK